MTNSDNCIFCKIIQKEIPAEIIYEDEEFIVFPTIRAHKKGHVLVIPKEHTDYIFDLSDEKLSALVSKVKYIAAGIKRAFKPGSGKVSVLTMGMGVHHVHVHLIPLDQEADISPETLYHVSPEEIKDAAQKIRENLA